jgi:hypothetical protein
MNSFQHLIGKRISRILRYDTNEDYDYFSPRDIFIMIDNDNGLFLASGAEDILFINYKDILENIEDDYFQDNLREVKDDDELKLLIGDSFKSIWIAKYKQDSLSGDTFEIVKGKYAGCIIETENHKLVYYKDSDSAFLSIDMDIDIPNKSNCILI